MDAKQIAALVLTVAETAKALTPLVQQALAVAGEDDASTLRASLAELEAAGDALHADVQAQLRG